LNNILVELKALTLPESSLMIGTVTGINADGTLNIETLIGSTEIVRGVANVGDTVTFQGMEIINKIKSETLKKYYIK
jgi:hypothetical protein